MEGQFLLEGEHFGFNFILEGFHVLTVTGAVVLLHPNIHILNVGVRAVEPSRHLRYPAVQIIDFLQQIIFHPFLLPLLPLKQH